MSRKKVVFKCAEKKLEVYYIRTLLATLAAQRTFGT